MSYISQMPLHRLLIEKRDTEQYIRRLESSGYVTPAELQQLMGRISAQHTRLGLIKDAIKQREAEEARNWQPCPRCAGQPDYGRCTYCGGTGQAYKGRPLHE